MFTDRLPPCQKQSRDSWAEAIGAAASSTTSTVRHPTPRTTPIGRL
jgi:hypothetical protein